GRNFQFAHHLVLFDLPLDPDLLEQRIGRLDRIGQHEKIGIHVPCFEQGAQAVMLRWYDQGLDAFKHTCPAGHAIFSQLLPALLECLEEPETSAGSCDVLVRTARQLLNQAGEILSKGRDHLLELNSCREPQASNLKRAIEREEASSGLARYMEEVLAGFGVESEDHSPGCLVLRPGAQMLDESFPGLLQDGMTCTFDRGTALIHEDRHFLTWEHPLVTGAMEMITKGTHGNSSCSVVRHPDINSGSMLLELLFVIECPAPRHLQSGRFLPPTLIRLLLDQQLNDCGTRFPRSVLTSARVAIEPAVAKKLAQNLRRPAQAMLARGKSVAEGMLPQILAAAETGMHAHYRSELERLEALARVNPSVSTEEISALQNQALELAEHLSSTHLRLDAVHLIVAL
ncbi:MAG TPA: RNA polymerase-associated protein RapA, partial [Gammaproteobacteria bacterium]|nr:RNA polymerase-associated protein RapA [Gammaproteobacteria bacterium]